MEHYQVRLVKRIESDGTIVTFPVLGKMYQFHDQKTLKSYPSLDEATSIAQNLNHDLPTEVKGMVIVRLKPGKGIIAISNTVKPHIKAQIRKSGTTDWVRFIDREGMILSLTQSRQIIRS